MTNYERPAVWLSEGSAEGVYAASGAVSEGEGGSGSAGGEGAVGGAGSSSVSVSQVELTSEGNQYDKRNIYTVTLQNDTGADSSDWSFTLTVTAGTAVSAQVYNGWLANASLSGNTITVTPGGGGTIKAGESKGIEVVVEYDGSDFITVQ